MKHHVVIWYSTASVCMTTVSLCLISASTCHYCIINKKELTLLMYYSVKLNSTTFINPVTARSCSYPVTIIRILVLWWNMFNNQSNTCTQTKYKYSHVKTGTKQSIIKSQDILYLEQLSLVFERKEYSVLCSKICLHSV